MIPRHVMESIEQMCDLRGLQMSDVREGKSAKAVMTRYSIIMRLKILHFKPDAIAEYVGLREGEVKTILKHQFMRTDPKRDQIKNVMSIETGDIRRRRQ